MKKLIGIVGKTSSGKDTIAHYISEKFGIKSICSYTTRPMREYEIEGIQHHFISDEVADEKLKNEHLLAYTINDLTGIRYFATAEQITDDVMIYIINPDGVDWFSKNADSSIVKMTTIYVDLDEEDILERAKLRGDDMDITAKRLNSEREEFDKFRDSKQWDYYVKTDKPQGYVETEINGIMKLILSDSVDKAED